MGEGMYRSTFSWPQHLPDVSGQLHTPAVLPTGERAPGTHWMGPRAGLDDGAGTLTPTSSVIQPVASRYTDWATTALQCAQVLRCNVCVWREKLEMGNSVIVS
jgi:hypothetical protein